jgi:hypothetical protein
MAYTVGERGRELSMPRVPGAIVPNGGGGALAVHGTKSKLFEVDVARRAGRGDVPYSKLPSAMGLAIWHAFRRWRRREEEPLSFLSCCGESFTSWSFAIIDRSA